MLRRLPIRWRVTAAFGGALALILAGVGAFLYLRMAGELDRALARGLIARAAEITALVSRGELPRPQPASNQVEADESLTQVLRPDGSIAASTSQLSVQLLTPTQAREALAGLRFVDRAGDVVLDENLRLLATPVQAPQGTMIVVVAASLDERTEALATLAAAEIIGLTAALVVSSLVGYGVAGLALRPVEALRRRATEITAVELASTSGPPLPVSGPDDEIGRLAATLNDMLVGLRAAQAAERSALERQQRFVAEASHQLRTPLAIIKSEVELADLAPAPATQRTALVSIGEEADRLVRLTDQLLTLAASDEDQLRVDKRQVLVADLLDRAAQRHRGRAAALGRSLSSTASSGLRLAGDELWLASALDNLLDNALEHGRGDIVLTGAAADGSVTLSVRDAGDGLGGQPDAFERFHKGRTSRGIGLGLSIVQAVAEAHGGSVAAGPGAEISIILPG